MIIERVSPKISFKQRVKMDAYENMPNPFLLYETMSNETGKNIPLDGITPEIKSQLYENINLYVQERQPVKGPVAPNLDENLSLDEFIDSQETSIPKTIPLELQEIDQRIKKHNIAKYQAAYPEFYFDVGDKISDFRNKIMPCDVHSKEFIERVSELNKFLSNGYELEINTENNELEKIVEEDMPTIFVFNHPNAPHDLISSFGFISELYSKYLEIGKGETCPRPKVFTSGVHDGFPQEYKELLEKGFVTPIDPCPYPNQNRAKNNSNAIGKIEKGFINSEYNLFHFPEGARRSMKNLPFEYRFQYGIAKIINKTINEQKTVRIIPVGLAAKENFGVVEIGEPVYFKKEDDTVLVSRGNFDSNENITNSNDYYKKLSNLEDNEFFPICYGNKIVKVKDEKSNKAMERLIAGNLCSNLEICANQANEKFIKIKEQEINL